MTKFILIRLPTSSELEMKYFWCLILGFTIGLFFFPDFVFTRSIKTTLFDSKVNSLTQNRARRNGKIYETVALKREFPTVPQLTLYWCAPAVLEAVLRYLGFDFRRLPERDNAVPAQIRSLSWQSSLGAQLGTRMDTGTITTDIPVVLNYLVNNYADQYTHGYRTRSFDQRNFDSQADLFYDSVYESLTHDFPVIFVHHGGFGRFIQYFDRFSFYLGKKQVLLANKSNYIFYLLLRISQS